MIVTVEKREMTGGNPTIFFPQEAKDAIGTFLRKVRNGAPLVMELKRHVKKRKSRTEEQHRYYFACLGEVAEWTGMSIADLHEFFKSKFLVDWNTGCEIPRIKSTKEASIDEMTRYIDEIKQFCLETLDFVIGDEEQSKL